MEEEILEQSALTEVLCHLYFGRQYDIDVIYKLSYEEVNKLLDFTEYLVVEESENNQNYEEIVEILFRNINIIKHYIEYLVLSKDNEIKIASLEIKFSKLMNRPMKVTPHQLLNLHRFGRM